MNFYLKPSSILWIDIIFNHNQGNVPKMYMQLLNRYVEIYPLEMNTSSKIGICLSADSMIWKHIVVLLKNILVHRLEKKLHPGIIFKVYCNYFLNFIFIASIQYSRQSCSFMVLCFIMSFPFLRGVISYYNLRLIKQLISNSLIRINFPSFLYTTSSNIFIA